MPKFFITDSSSITDEIVITGEDARHIGLSLRMKCGETLVATDGENNYFCSIAEIKPDFVRSKIERIEKIQCEPPYEVVLFQALPKSDKMDEIVRQTVECGVSRIVPFLSSRCISRPDEKLRSKKIERWNKISKEAAMQSGRGIIPQVAPVITFSEIFQSDDFKKDDRILKLFFYEGECVRSLPEVLSEHSLGDFEKIYVVIGSEGGFSLSEAEHAQKNGFCLCGLGKRILRCENAPVVALSCISFKYEM